MSEQEPKNSLDLGTKEREIALKEQEIKAKIELDKRGVWFSSLLLIGVSSAIVSDFLGGMRLDSSCLFCHGIGASTTQFGLGSSPFA